jgi:hypothetical protein
VRQSPSWINSFAVFQPQLLHETNDVVIERI